MRPDVRGPPCAFATIDRIVTRMRCLLPALGAFFMFGTLVAGCGDSVPGNAVASVDGKGISRAEFKHWMGIAAATNQGAAGPRFSYDPPNFAACVAAKRKTAPK